MKKSFDLIDDRMNITAHNLMQGFELKESRSLDIYLYPQEVLQRFPTNKGNLNPDAVAEAMKYMNLYRTSYVN